MALSMYTPTLAYFFIVLRDKIYVERCDHAP
jgi:hypothetical protein